MTDNETITIDTSRLTQTEINTLARKNIFLSQPASDVTSILTITSSAVNNFTAVQCTFATGLSHGFDEDQIAYLRVLGM